MNRLLVSAAALLFGALPAHAQSLVSGKVQTGTPTYANDQNVPLSVDATGALKVTGGGAPLATALPKITGGPTTARTAVATGSTATVILPTGRSDEMVSLKNSGSVRAYIGGTGVTAANGWPLAVGESMTMDAKIAQGGISAILDTGQATAGEIAVWRF